MNKDNKTTFIFMGDPQCSRISAKRCDYSQWEDLLKTALDETEKIGGCETTQPLLILGGDIVNRGNKNRMSEWEAFFGVCDDVRLHGSNYRMATPVTGAEESAGMFADCFVNPGNGPFGHEKEFFSFDYGCCHFLFLDSSYMGNRDKNACKFIGNWIKADLAANRKPAVFAVMHHPMYTVGTSFGDDVRAGAMRDNYQKLLYRYGVDIILCGHQHVYSRTKQSQSEYAIMQIMGISGGKHFDAQDKSSMAVVREHVPVVTLFETDGEEIRLRTIDKDGQVLDEYVQPIRLKKKRRCETCVNFDRCHSIRKYERDPLKPDNDEGISIQISENGSGGRHFSDKELGEFQQTDVIYSVMRRSGMDYEPKRGIQLHELFERAGAEEMMNRSQEDSKVTAIIITDSKGHQTAFRMDEVMNGWRYGEDKRDSEKCKVPALIIRENDKYRLIFGQQNPNQFNGQGWARDIRHMELRLL